VLLAQELIARLNINFVAPRFFADGDDRRIDHPSSPILVSE
jgi:hypothetical protein